MSGDQSFAPELRFDKFSVPEVLETTRYVDLKSGACKGIFWCVGWSSQGDLGLSG